MTRRAIAVGPPVAGSATSTLEASLRQRVIASPGGRFIFEGAPQSSAELTFADAYQTARHIHAGLVETGHRPGDRIVLDATSPETFIPALWASILGGMIAVPVGSSSLNGPRASASAQRLEHLTSRLNGFTVISDREEMRSLGRRHFEFSNIMSQHSAEMPELDPSSPALLILTSGTTGHSQLVTLSRRALAHRWFHSAPIDLSAFLGWMPMEHIMGLGLASPSHALKVHLAPELFGAGPRRWLDLAAKWRVTNAGMTNFGMKLILEAAGDEREWDLSSMRRIGVGAEPISPALCSRFCAFLAACGAGSEVVALGYGLSECGPVAGGRLTFSRAPAAPETGQIAIDAPTAGHSIRVVDEAGQLRSEGEIGSIEVVGPTMTSGYYSDSLATSRLFTPDGWLRTGDLGFLSDGVLTVVGREKETLIVNARKYPLAEIDDVIAGIPAVRGAHAFAIQDSRGEQRLAIAYVAPRPSASVERAIREALVARWGLGVSMLFPILETDIPRTATGKLQRNKLAELLGPADSEPASQLPATSPIQRIALALSQFTGGHLMGGDDDFFLSGGDSLGALRATMAIEREFSVSVPPAIFATHSTPRQLLNYIETRTSGESRVAAVPVQTSEGGPNLFIAPGILGSAGYAMHLSRSGLDGMGVWAFHVRNPGDNSVGAGSLSELVAECVEVMRRIQPHGPYNLLGYSFGGLVAYAMACHLRELGLTVSTVALVDMPAPLNIGELGSLSRPVPKSVVAYHRRLVLNHDFSASDIRVSYFRARDSWHATLSDPAGGWSYLAQGGVDCYEVPGDHHSIVQGPNARELAQGVARSLRGAPPPQHVAALPIDPSVRALVSGASRACQLGRAPDEIAGLRRALAEDPSFPYWGYQRLAGALLAAGFVDEGITAYRQAVARDPWPLATVAKFVRQFKKLGKTGLCREAIASARAETVTSAAAAAAKYTIFRQFRLWKQAEVSLAEGLSIAPEAFDLRVMLVNVLRQQGEAGRARNELRLAAEFPSSNNFALKSLGLQAMSMGCADDAERLLRRSVAIDPDEDPSMLRTLAEFARRRGDAAEAERLGVWASSLSSGGVRQVFGGGSIVDWRNSRLGSASIATLRRLWWSAWLRRATCYVSSLRGWGSA